MGIAGSRLVDTSPLPGIKMEMKIYDNNQHTRYEFEMDIREFFANCIDYIEKFLVHFREILIF